MKILIICSKRFYSNIPNIKNELDNIKTQYCKDNNIKLLRIPYWEFDKENTYQKSILNILNI